MKHGTSYCQKKTSSREPRTYSDTREGSNNRFDFQDTTTTIKKGADSNSMRTKRCNKLFNNP